MKQIFWKEFRDNKTPIIGLSPMDGVTDAAFRYMIAKYSKPSVVMTEFTNVEGLSRGIVKLLDDFIYSSLERPVIAQVFGTTPHDFYRVAIICCFMGFDGIDINMGCPDSDVAKRGGGAALILNPVLAKQIIASVQKGVDDWANGIELSSLNMNNDMIHFLDSFVLQQKIVQKREIIPVSVKTRIGFQDIVITEWVQHLLEMNVQNISIHGRTLRQMYTGSANWEEIGKAAEIIRQTDTTVLGNGDIKTLEDAHEKIKKYKLDGVLVGRATFGNPFFFSSEPKELTINDRLDLCLEHTKYYLQRLPHKPFIALRKHLAWYMKGFDGAVELRTKLVRVNSLEELEAIALEYRK